MVRWVITVCEAFLKLKGEGGAGWGGLKKAAVKTLQDPLGDKRQKHVLYNNAALLSECERKCHFPEWAEQGNKITETNKREKNHMENSFPSQLKTPSFS